MTDIKKIAGMFLIAFGILRFVLIIVSLFLGKTLISQIWDFMMCIILVGAGIYFYRKY